MDKVMTKQESYVERRQLFKNIWETAMHIDDKDLDVMDKPKVIKTLRMDEIDKCPIGKSKKQRIKNLRHVCNKILDFCDKQEEDDKIYEQIAAEANQSPIPIAENKVKKLKKTRHRKKIKKAKSMLAPKTATTVARATISAKDADPLSDDSDVSRKRSPLTFKFKTDVGLSPYKIRDKSPITAGPKLFKPTTTSKLNPKLPTAEDYPKEVTNAPHRKVVKKKRFKKKKHYNAMQL